MSRVGKRIINIPEGTEVNINGSDVTIKGKNGTLERSFSPLIEIKLEGSNLTTVRKNEEKHTKQLHGTTNSLLSGMVIGVSEGFTKEITIKGVGYKAALAGDKLTVNAGYSHPVVLDVIEGVKVEVVKPTELKITGADKQKVGQMAALIRDIRRPNPYSGKGIMYKDEVIRRKEGKAAAR